jgi:1-acyl-sn-glycerol-3-phosphate acyltransferase
MVRKGRFIYSITRAMARVVFSTLYHIEIEREARPSWSGASVILPKHQYWTDIPLVALSFAMPLRFVAKQELFRYPGIRFYLRMLGGIPIDREKTIRTLTDIRTIFARLRASEALVIFPEGTYVPGYVGSGKSRLIQMILSFQSELQQRIPFIPMGIRYGQRDRWRRRVEIRVGPPLFAEGQSEAEVLTQRAMEEIRRLSRLPPVAGNSKYEIRSTK